MEHIYFIVQKDPNIAPLTQIIKGFFEDYSIKYLDKTALLISIPMGVEENSLEDMYPLWLSDIEEPFRLLVLPNIAFDIIALDDLLSILKSLPAKAYHFTEILFHTIQSNTTMKHSIIKKINTVLSPSLIATLLRLAEADMNMSIAAKKLFIHRNTMLYRVDQIHTLTGIDPKHFEGLLIFYLLFKR